MYKIVVTGCMIKGLFLILLFVFSFVWVVFSLSLVSIDCAQTATDGNLIVELKQIVWKHFID